MKPVTSGFIHWIRQEAVGFILSQSAASPSASASPGEISRLNHFNSTRLCQRQLLWLLWNSDECVSGEHWDSKCDSSCHFGIPVLTIWLSIEWECFSWCSSELRIEWRYRCWSELLVMLHGINRWGGIVQLSCPSARGLLCVSGWSSAHVRTVSVHLSIWSASLHTLFMQLFPGIIL